VTGEGQWRDLAVRAWDPIRNMWNRFSPAEQTGGVNGLGALIYGASVMSHLLQDVSLLDLAEDITHSIDRGTLVSSRSFGVLDGSAGLLLSLLGLYDQRPSQAVLERAEWCAEHLMDHLEAKDGKGAGSGPSMTGFAHGAAGMAYALARLGATSQNDRMIEAASQAIAYEDGQHTPSGDWVNHHNSLCAWCQGAAGVALSRLATLPVLKRHDDADIHHAMEEILSRPSTCLDVLCCGNMGRALILHTTGQRLENDVYLTESRRLAGQIIVHERITGYHLVGPGADHHFRAGLFQGLAGIGYGFLRLAAPRIVPNVLLWETAPTNP
ncbi:MAG: hypothetical protein GYB68_18300, partial [Chloroflexi bacterium]|nr:hypothetical protein [Chloroflexota bacterium]